MVEKIGGGRKTEVHDGDVVVETMRVWCERMRSVERKRKGRNWGKQRRREK